MKSIHEPIDIDLGDDGAPRSWRWRSRVWRVLRVLDRWVLQSRWWAGHGERRDYLLVEAAPDGAARPPEACAVEIYLRRCGTGESGGSGGTEGPGGADEPGGAGRRHDAWILARILS